MLKILRVHVTTDIDNPLLAASVIIAAAHKQYNYQYNAHTVVVSAKAH
jgi:hypothetical protein